MGALAWRLSRLGWALGLGPLQSLLCSGMWSSQNLLERPWQGLRKVKQEISSVPMASTLPHLAIRLPTGSLLSFLQHCLGSVLPSPSKVLSGLQTSNSPPYISRDSFINLTVFPRTTTPSGSHPNSSNQCTATMA